MLRRSTLVALVAYAGYAIFLTWPLATDPGGLLSGPALSGDLAGSVSHVAYIVQHHVSGLVPTTLHGLNAPEGVSEAWVQNWASLPGTLLLYGLGYAFGAVGGSNVFLWLSFVLSGLSMFLLTRRLFGSAGAALLAGFAFAFYPFAVDKLNGHYQYMSGWVLVLGIWRMIELADRPNLRNALLGGGAAAFGMWFTPYFILIGGVGFATMEVVVLITGVVRQRLRAAVTAVIVAGAPIVVLFGALGGLAVIAGGNETGAVRTQSIAELYAYSARWLEWLLPDRNNLIFGGLTGGYLTSHLHGSNFSESSLYLGLSVLALAVGGCGLAAASFWRRPRAALGDIRIVAALSGGMLALVAAVFSAPPTIQMLGVSVEMPAGWIFKITSTWRVYTRFVELIELGLCISAAFAVARLLAGRSLRAGTAITVSLGAVLVLDLWARPPVRTVSVTPPPEYVWLREHPGGIVADYPIEPAVFPDYAALFWQPIDRHALFQGYDTGSESESLKLDLGDLREPGTAAGLAALGVRYIVVHPGFPGADRQTIEQQHYIVRFASPDGSVWQVGAAPAPARVDMLDGFSLLQGDPGFEYRWMDGPGVLGVYARNCASCRGQVNFQSSSNAVVRMLTVRDERTGRVLVRAVIPPGRSVPVGVPDVQLRHGQARLLLTTDIPPRLPPDGDPRLLSITVMEPSLNLSASGQISPGPPLQR